MQGVVVRTELDREARGFVFATLAQSYAKHAGMSNPSSFRAAVVAPVERALADGRLDVRLMVLDGSPDDFVGWSASSGDALVYVYVKQAYRRRGFGRELLPDGLTRAVYQTPAGVALERSRYGRPLRYAPYLLMEAA